MELKPGYKQTEIGVIPDDWSTQSLGELGSLKNGINKAAEDFGHGSPFINLMDVFGIPKAATSTDSLGLVSSTEAEQKTYELRRGDVLFVRSSVKPEGVGLTTLIPEDLPGTVFSGFLIRFRDHGQLIAEFKEHCFLSDGFRRRLIANSTVSANTNINQDALKRLHVGFPPNHDEQRAIATALSDVDALLEGLDRLIAKKRDLKQAAMQQLLTGETRLEGFDEEWTLRRLGGHVTFLSHGTNSRAELRPDGPVKYLHYGDIHARTLAMLEPSSLPSLPEDKAKGLDRLRDGDLVFADASEDLTGVSKSVEICGAGSTELVAGLHTIAARFDKDILADGFKAYLQFCPAFSTQLRRLAAGTKVYATNRAHVASIEMRLPGVQEQSAIASIFSDMDAEIEALEQRRAKTVNLRQAMMQELLTGKTRLVEPQVSDEQTDSASNNANAIKKSEALMGPETAGGPHA